MSEIYRTKGDMANFQLPNNRTESKDRQIFLKHFVQAQMVVYEAADADQRVSLSRGWFFWTLKMEFGALGEWDFLRGYEEGWIPSLPTATESAESLFGTCKEIAAKTLDDDSIVSAYPDPKTHPDLWSGPPADDDFVVSHANSIKATDNGKDAKSKPKPTTTTKGEDSKSESQETKGQKRDSNDVSSKEDTKIDEETKYTDPSKSGARAWFPMFCVFFFAWGIWKVFLNDGNILRNRRQYTNLDAPTQLSV